MKKITTLKYACISFFTCLFVPVPFTCLFVAVSEKFFRVFISYWYAAKRANQPFRNKHWFSNSTFVTSGSWCRTWGRSQTRNITEWHTLKSFHFLHLHLYFSSSLAHLHIRCRLSHHPFPYSSISWGCFTRVPAISLAGPEMSITGLWWSPCCIMHRSVPLGKKWPTAKERWMEGWIMDGEMEERTTNAIYVSPNWRVALAHTPDALGRVTPRLSDFWG